MKKIILPVVGLVIGLAVLGGVWYYYNFNKYAPTTYVTEVTTETGTTTTTIDTTTGTQTPGAPRYTLAEVSAHNSATSCYSIVNGKVYDLTMWVNLHPGGKQAILSMCGVDGTAKFMGQHHGAQKQMDILARYYIGLTQ